LTRVMSPVLPLHRTIVAVDIEGSTTRTNPVKAHIRQAMYDAVEEALQTSGITEQRRDPLIDRGDGVLVLVRPVDQIPKTVLLSIFVPALTELLAEHNGHLTEHRFRLRVALHAGEVLYDRRGPFGEAIDITCRLLDAPELKSTLERATAPLALVVSDDIHRSVVRHGYDGIADQSFELLVHLDFCGQPQRGWVHMPVTSNNEWNPPTAAVPIHTTLAG
jgi:class 3 adenylate cyclase